MFHSNVVYEMQKSLREKGPEMTLALLSQRKKSDPSRVYGTVEKAIMDYTSAGDEQEKERVIDGYLMDFRLNSTGNRDITRSKLAKFLSGFEDMKFIGNWVNEKNLSKKLSDSNQPYVDKEKEYLIKLLNLSEISARKLDCPSDILKRFRILVEEYPQAVKRFREQTLLLKERLEFNDEEGRHI